LHVNGNKCSLKKEAQLHWTFRGLSCKMIDLNAGRLEPPVFIPEKNKQFLLENGEPSIIESIHLDWDNYFSQKAQNQL
ncbi:unnamed protein product, partial [Dovyalis caffra]